MSKNSHEKNTSHEKNHPSETPNEKYRRSSQGNEEEEEIVIRHTDSKYNWEVLKEKGVDLVHNLETNPKTKNFWQYAQTHKKEAILGACMLFGLLFSFLWIGGFLVGIVAGLYAPWGFKSLWNRGVEFSEQEKFITFVVLVTIIFMLLHIFPFIIGSLVGLGVKSFTRDEPAENTQSQKLNSEHDTEK